MNQHVGKNVEIMWKKCGNNVEKCGCAVCINNVSRDRCQVTPDQSKGVLEMDVDFNRCRRKGFSHTSAAELGFQRSGDHFYPSTFGLVLGCVRAASAVADTWLFQKRAEGMRSTLKLN